MCTEFRLFILTFNEMALILNRGVGIAECLPCVELPSGSVSDYKARGPGFESRWGQRNLVMELVNIYRVLSCSFVEIKRLYVVSVCIN